MNGIHQQCSWLKVYNFCKFLHISSSYFFAFSAFTLLAGRQEGHLDCKNGGRWRWALVSPAGVAPSQKVAVSVC